MLRLVVTLVLVARCSACLHTAAGYTCNYPTIGAGYTPPTAVTAHASLDLDQKGIEDALKKSPVDYSGAKTIYDNGGLSQKPTKSIKSFSSSASSKMAAHKEFLKYNAYYGDGDYADKWVQAALAGTPTAFSSGKGNADFAVVSDDDTRIQGVKKGTVFLGFWMWVLYELEAGIDNCVTGQAGNSNAVHRWDEGVAFYTGSLQTTQDTASGNMMYALSQKRCINFNTCGPAGGALTGISQANTKVFAAFNSGLKALEEGRCTDIRPFLDTATAHGAVPLIQGALKYAYTKAGSTRSTKALAEAATFAAAILPRVASCSSADAAIIYDALKIGATSTDFKVVKKAFENNYACMNITCADVGGYMEDGVYLPDAAPCTGSSGSDDDMKQIGLILSIVGGTLCGIGILFGARMMMKKSKAKKGGAPSTETIPTVV